MHTIISEYFFGSCNVHKLLFGSFLLSFVLEIVWMPFLGKFSVSLCNLFFAGVTSQAQNFVVVSLGRLQGKKSCQGSSINDVTK